MNLVVKKDAWKSPDFRQRLCLRVKESFIELNSIINSAIASPSIPPVEETSRSRSRSVIGGAPPTIASSQNSVAINESLNELALRIEAILFHGIRIDTTNPHNISFWLLLLKIEKDESCPTVLKKSINHIATTDKYNLNTIVGKARGWIRYSINTNCLTTFLEFILNRKDILSSHFYKDSFLLSTEDVNNLLYVLSQHVFSSEDPVNLSAGKIKFSEYPLSINSSLNFSPPYFDRYSNLILSLIKKRKENRLKNAEKEKKAEGASTGFLANIATFITGLNLNETTNVSSGATREKRAHSNVDSQIAAAETGTSLVTKENLTDEYLNVSSFCPSYMVKFFSSSLRDLLQDPSRSSFALIDCKLGIPKVIDIILNYLISNADNRGLFRNKVKSEQLYEVKKLVESGSLNFQLKNSTPNSNGTNLNLMEIDVDMCYNLLINWLIFLPEPLLGFDSYEAFIACLDISDSVLRIKALKTLISDIPWYNKPLLIKILKFLSTSLLPENNEKNNFSIVSCTTIFTPLLLRKGKLISRSKKNSAAAGSIQATITFNKSNALEETLVEFIISNYEDICLPIVQELYERRVSLKLKCEGILKLQQYLINGEKPQEDIVDGGETEEELDSSSGNINDEIIKQELEDFQETINVNTNL